MELAGLQQRLADRRLRGAGRAVAEAEDVRLGPVRDLEAGALAQQLPQAQRLRVLILHVLGEPALPAEREAQEDLQPELRLRALDLAVDRVDAVRVVEVEVGGALAEGSREIGAPAYENGRAERRRAEHLVGVPDDRVGELDAVE